MSSSHLIRLLIAICPIFAWAAPVHKALVPTTVVKLFNGKDLSNFYTWLAGSGYEDPDGVFTVMDQVDGAPAIRISGKHWGGLVTKEWYANYRLVVEYRWGSGTWGSRANRAKDSGIMLHCQGPDGNNHKDLRSPWMRSIEFQIIEGGTGDMILVGGYDYSGAPNRTIPTVTTTVKVMEDQQYWHPGGKAHRPGRINWLGKNLDWKDALGFRAPQDLEKPGQWTRLEAECIRDELRFFVNGVKVNEARDSSLREGKIFIQSEGAELYIRAIELHPLHTGDSNL